MKPKRKQSYKWSNSEKFVWFIYVSIPVLFSFYLILVLVPPRFETRPEIIPTAEYLQGIPQEDRVRLAVERVSENNDSMHNVCLQNVSYRIAGLVDNQAWELYIDGNQVGMLPAERKPSGFWTCNSRIYLAKGLHLIEYQNRNLDIFLEWAIEIE